MRLKYISYIFLAGVLFYTYSTYNKVKKYNANNPNSLSSMLMLTPTNQKRSFISDFNLVSKDMRSTNLHGLTREEIGKLANEYRTYLNKKQTLLQKVEQ